MHVYHVQHFGLFFLIYLNKTNYKKLVIDLVRECNGHPWTRFLYIYTLLITYRV